MRLEIIFGLVFLIPIACAPNYHFAEPPCTTQVNCLQAEDIQIGRMWALAQQDLAEETSGSSYLVTSDTWSFEEIPVPNFDCGGEPAWGCIDVNMRHIKWVRGRPLSLSHECMHAILYDLQQKDWGVRIDGSDEEGAQ